MPSSPNGKTDYVDVTDMPDAAEHPTLTTSHLAGPRLTPEQLITVMPPDEWEQFIVEWANCLKKRYKRVRRYSGPGDRGRDVVGFLDDEGLQGEWDCYQCKHYFRGLYPSDALPEIAKIILGVLDGFYSMPRRYRFVAPKGAGPSLEHLFSDPDQLRRELVKALDSPVLAHLTADDREKLRDAAPQINFKIFDIEPLENILELHRTSRHHRARFGGPLEPRPPSPEPPDDLTPQESKYLEKLLRAYREKLDDPNKSLEAILDIQWYGDHLSRQRMSFFSAEALRAFARDKVPVGTFEMLQNEIYEGVVETEQRDHSNGLERLTAVLEAACSVHPDENALITVSRTPDKKGICHQLANEDRLHWQRLDT